LPQPLVDAVGVDNEEVEAIGIDDEGEELELNSIELEALVAIATQDSI